MVRAQSRTPGKSWVCNVTAAPVKTEGLSEFLPAGISLPKQYLQKGLKVKSQEITALFRSFPSLLFQAGKERAAKDSNKEPIRSNFIPGVPLAFI